MGSATARLQKEYKAILKEPVPNIIARPSQSNILDWHYILIGAEGTEYDGGHYHGKVTFPSQYPFKPPAIYMCTPSGRFQCNTRLCLSMSDFHPEAWTPMWSVSTILAGLISFMYDDVKTTGSITTSSGVKKQLARDSIATNLKNPTFCRIFSDKVDEMKGMVIQREQEDERNRAAEVAQTNGQDIHQNSSKVKPSNTAGNNREGAQEERREQAGTIFGWKLTEIAFIMILVAGMAVPFLTADSTD
mmetsp:Transcript_4256/g.4907  ORF Transcript_4256/g.4907 Transcript_4256/m.4907 type:complete len:246 (+) Transcript_4256:282-1019(+)|eukprot:CAMPEP_0197855416 /NCGR_PEP_ID=MMETSP1438-20131217/26609_1 /TAXON_ID=1461541 /ORGANISM="Pterosperma sp., Strain CCMP1384" /LENGTH=245 /DNA_ID=CAMNT_0043470515 /DNA_START=272 /DNA_END=1009 /DNA_ORIENTATION=+